MDGDTERTQPLTYTPTVPELHEARADLRRRLLAAIGIAAGAAALEVVGSWLSGSLALLSDAGHVGTDGLALGLTLWAVRVSKRPHTPHMSFGYHRTEVLAALGNAILLLGIAAYLVVQAYERSLTRPPVSGDLMFLIGLAGLGANLIMLALLRGWSRKNINVRGAFLHTYGDALGSVAVVAGALLIQATGNVLVDPLVALAVAALLAVSGVRLLRDSVRIVLEASPAGLTPEAVAAAISSFPGIRGIHDLHIWTVTSGFLALTGHVLVAGDTTVQEATRIVDGVEAILRERFGIAHATLQVDSVQEELISPADVREQS